MAGPSLDVLLQVTGGALSVALAVFLLRVKTPGPATRAFAAFLALLGVYNLVDTVNTFANNAGDPGLATVAARFGGPFATAAVIPALVFAFSYPRPRLPRWLNGPAWMMCTLAVLLAGILVPGLTSGVVTSVFAEGRVQSIPAGLGVAVFFVPVFAAVAIVLGIAHARERDGPVRRSVSLIAIGFVAVAGMIIGASALLFLRAEAIGLPTSVVLAAVASRALLAVGVLAVWLPQARTSRAAAALVLVFLLALAAGALPVLSVGGWRATVGVVLGIQFFFRLLLPLLVTYALVRHQLFDIDLKIKWTLRRGTVAAAFLAIFFVVAELAQNFFSSALGWIYGGVAAGLMLFALAPLQRVAERVADKAMPGVADTDEWRASRRMEAYRFSLRAALLDGRLTREEERRLATLAEELGIGNAAALEARDAVARELGLSHITVQT